jgi:hypothetical protein
MGDLNTGELKAFYSGNTDKVSYIEREKMGSNGSLWHRRKQPQEMPFYISIHTSFILDRVQISSEEGLNAYGAVTWGHFLFTRV